MTDRIKSYLDEIGAGLKRPVAPARGSRTQNKKAPQARRGRPPTRVHILKEKLRDPLYWAALKMNRQWTMRVRRYGQMHVRVILALAALDGPAHEPHVRQVMRCWRGDVGDRMCALAEKGLARRVAPGRFELTDRGREVAGLLG